MEQSNNIEEQLIPERIRGKTFYRCPYPDCRKKFDRKQPTVDHVRSIHLQLKSFCENCEKNVSLVAFRRHVRSCIGGKVVAEAAEAEKPLNIRNVITRSATSTRPRLMHTTNAQNGQCSMGQRSVYGTHIPKVNYKQQMQYTHKKYKVEHASSQQLDQMRTPNSVINEIALLWSYERSREDELDLFGKYVASEMRVLTRNDQVHLKKRIQQLLLEYDPPEQSGSVGVATIQSVNLSSTETGMLSELGYSGEASNISQHAESVDYGIQSLIIPKVEPDDWPVAEDDVSMPKKCLFCNRYDSEIFHGNVHEINSSYTHTPILDIADGWLGSYQSTENCVCCDTCLRKINKYDLERLNLQKMLQSDLSTLDIDT